MADIASITLPIFLLVALGFAAARSGAIDQEFIRGLGFFVLNFAMPALILHALLAQDFSQSFNVSFLLAYGLGSLAVFVTAVALFTLIGRGRSHAAIGALGSAGSNSGFVAFPLATLAVGAPALVALPMALLVENVLIIPLALTLAELGRNGTGRAAAALKDTALRLVRMPLILAIALGIVLSTAGVRPPEAISTAIEMLANASIACALFTVGGTLAVLQPATDMAADVGLISIAKLLVHPAAVAACFWLIGGEVPSLLFVAAMIHAAAPMLTVYPIFGQRYGLGPLASMALLVATAVSFVSLSLLLVLLLDGDMTAAAAYELPDPLRI